MSFLYPKNKLLYLGDILNIMRGTVLDLSLIHVKIGRNGALMHTVTASRAYIFVACIRKIL